MSIEVVTLYSHNMSKAPTPQTRTAYLPSAGYDYMRATKHKFVKAVERSFAIPNTTDKYEDCWVFIYACENTGAERVWGYELKMGPAVLIN